MLERYLLYFVVGGTVIALVTYLGSQGRGWVAAFVAMFPAMTVMTFVTVYIEGGIQPVRDYILGLFFVLPAWLLYLSVVYYATERIGLISILLGILVYITVSLFSYLLLK